MERFALNIDKSFKTNVFKICRLCGIDNPHKVAILEEVVSLLDGEDELPLYKKIFNCIGIQVAADDKMPKTICALCFDKINDFHEFREMCYSTNAQTRKLLGLQPQVEKKWTPNTLFNPVASEQLESLQRRNSRKRKNEDIPPDIKFDNKMIKLENQPTNFLANLISNKNNINVIKTERNNIILDRKGNKKAGPPLMVCNICQVNFCSAALLQSHLLKVHVPIIARYHCVQCNETIGNSLEIKNHNLWHRLSKTPFKCGRCEKTVISLQGLTRHMRECSKKIIRQVKILPNVECKYCSIEFETKNLYFMHHCVTMKLRCPKCNCKMSNPITTFKHIASCSVKIKEDSKCLLEDDFIIKNEPIDLPSTLPGAPVPLLAPLSLTLDIKPSLVNHNPSMVVIPPLSSSSISSDSQLTASTKENSKKNKIKKDTEDAIRRCDELLNTMKTLVSIKHEPVDGGITNVHSNLSESTKQSSFNTTAPSTTGQQDLSAIRIKQEVIDAGYRDMDSNIEINIKQEITEKPALVQPALKLKIKKEHGTLNASFIQNENYESGIGGGGSESEVPSNNIESNKNNESSMQTKKSKSTDDENLNAGNVSSTLKPGEELDNYEKHKKTAAILPTPMIIKQEIIEKENSDQEDEIPPLYDDLHHGDYDSDDYDNNSPNNQDNTNMIPIISNLKTVKKKTPEKNKEVCKNKNDVINKSSTISPLPMLTISSISSGGNVVQTTNDILKSTENLNKDSTETEDTELSQHSFIPQILSVSGGVELSSKDDNQLTESSNQHVENNFIMQNTENNFIISSVSSGAEVPSPSVESTKMSIASVSSSVELPSSSVESTKMSCDGDYISNFNFIQIKKEKIDPGYNDHYEEIQNNDDEQQLAQNSNIDNTYQYDMNFVGAVRIKQEIEFAEEGFGDEVQSEYSEGDNNNSDYENELNNDINDINMEEIQSNDMKTIKDNENEENMSLNNINYENNENTSNEEIQNSTNVEFSLSPSTNIVNNFKENLMDDYINNTNFIDDNNKMPIISQVNSININDIYKIQNINTNIVNSEICYSQNYDGESLNQNNTENDIKSNDVDNNHCNLTENNVLNQNEIIEQIEPQITPTNENEIPNLLQNLESHQEIDEIGNLINFINHPLSGTSSLSSNNSLESALTVPVYKNINEIAENHNNENFEKMKFLNNEITEQNELQIRPTIENETPNLLENIERHQEIDENILNINDNIINNNDNNESINTINNSNIILDNNIGINTLPPSD